MALPTQFGAFTPITFIWDIQKVAQLDIQPEFKELLIRLYQNLTLMANLLNISDKGINDINEFVTGELLFSELYNNSAGALPDQQRQIRRKVVVFGALPDAGSKSVPHNIVCTTATLFVGRVCWASDQTGFNYIPIPYASALGTTNIELSVDFEKVTITTASNRSSFNQCLVILAYVQS